MTFQGKITFSLHAEKKMARYGIEKSEAIRCILEGKTVAAARVGDEIRYATESVEKERKIVVVYIKNDRIKVITCYPLKRRWPKD